MEFQKQNENKNVLSVFSDLSNIPSDIVIEGEGQTKQEDNVPTSSDELGNEKPLLIFSDAANIPTNINDLEKENTVIDPKLIRAIFGENQDKIVSKSKLRLNPL